jgi:broad specificity phosphatase PhoE
VICHRAVARALYAYFLQLPPADAPHLPMPLHTVIQLTPTAYGCEEERVALEPRVSE